MRTFLKIAVAVLALALLALPGALGVLTYPAFERVIAQTRENAGVDADAGRVQRGWFATTQVSEDPIMDPESIELAVAFLGVADIDELPVIETRVVYTHGPLPLLAPGRGGLQPALGVANIEWFVRSGEARKALPARLMLRAGLTRTRLEGWIEPFESALKNGGTLTFSGASVSADSPARRIDFVGGGDMGSLTLRAQGLEWLADDMPLSFRYQQPVNGLADSSVALKIGTLSVREQDDATINRIAVRNLTAATQSAGNDGRYLSSLTIGLEELASDEFSATDMRLDLLMDIDASHLGQIHALAANQNDEQAQERIKKLAVDTLSRGVRLTLRELSFTSDKGTLQSDFIAHLPAGTHDPMAMPHALIADGRVRLPYALLREIAAGMANGEDMLRYGLRSGMLKRNGELVESQFEFADGALRVNGVDVPLPF